MIKTIIENPVKLDLVRDVFKSYIKDFSQNIRVDFKALSCSFGINVCDDKRSLRVNISVKGFIYYSIIRSDYHRITCEYGIKEQEGNYAVYKTRLPKDYIEYMICNNVTIYCLRAIYEVLELGKIKRDDE